MDPVALLLAFLRLPLYFLLEVFYFLFRCRPCKPISNLHVLITGAGQGIGAEFARQFAEMGNTVHCLDISKELVEGVVATLHEAGHSAHAYTCDLTKSEEVEKVHKEITENGHVVTVLINNAGVVFGANIEDMSLTQIQHSLTVNLVSGLWTIKLFLPQMLAMDQGHVVNIASMLGLMPLQGQITDYCAGKAGAIHALAQLRNQHAHTNVHFTAVCPWFVRTKLIAGIEKETNPMEPEELVRAAIQGIREEKDVVMVPDSVRFIHFLLKISPLPIRDAFYKKKPDFTKFVGHKLLEKVQ